MQKNAVAVKTKTQTPTTNLQNEQQKENLLSMVPVEKQQLYTMLGTSDHGMTAQQVQSSRERYGSNTVVTKKGNPVLKRFLAAYVNPFTIVLFVLATVSLFTDVIFADPGDRDWTTIIILSIMVIVSGTMRFVQETRSNNAAAHLKKMISTTTRVERVGTGEQEIPLDDVVVGDMVVLAAGDIIPADVRLVETKDLYVSQSALTGESAPVEKIGDARDFSGEVTDAPNLAFMGSNIVSGSAKAIVLAVGNNTMFGGIAKSLEGKAPKTEFEKGVNDVTWVLIRFMLIMVPVVMIINGLTKGDWLQALLFGISVAVGLTPEMLPMIVTANMAKGAVAMSHRKVIIKNLNSIQNIGAIDVLCTDKTGTLTEDRVVLEKYLNVHGHEDKRILRHAFLNAYYQTGLKNLMDRAIIARQESLGMEKITSEYTKVDEIPFDFNRRRLSVVVADKQGKTQMVTKGAVEEMLDCCAYAELGGQVSPLTEDARKFVQSKADELNAQGMRVLAVAQKTNPRPVGEFSVEDESDMVLIGFLAFLDPPKTTTASAIQSLNQHGVGVKILTGDNDKVTKAIAAQVGLNVDEVLLGSDIQNMSDEELGQRAENVTVFAKLSPDQKSRVVRALRQNGHVVGFMGDGINDAPSMRAADVGISVDTAVDIAKESADVILLEKDLNVLEDGVIEGRRTYANTIKYIKMTASSNFGNMFSELAAAAFLPFLPMAPIHLVVLNLIYDLSCTAIPWDNVDEEMLETPQKWDAKSVGSFMRWIGPTSSVFDITTYLLMYFIICPQVCGGPFHTLGPAQQAVFIALFHTGWFVESMWSQTLVIHMIRTPKIPFIQSHASLPVTALTFTGIAVLTLIPFTPLGTALTLHPLPPIYFAWLALTIFCYMVLATCVKMIYTKRFGKLL